MARTDVPSTGPRTQPRLTGLRLVAAGTAALIAVVYGLLFADVLSIAGATAGDRGILGVAGAVFLVLAVLLWLVRSRWLWAGAALLQVLLAVMYLAVAPERDPSFEVWGLTIRALSAVLLITLLALIAGTLRRRSPTA